MRSTFPVESFNTDLELEAIPPRVAGQGKGSGSTTSLIVRGAALPAAPALTVKNFWDPKVPRMRYGETAPGRPVTELIVHDTISTNLANTITDFLADKPTDKQKSVHLIVAADGSITQHGDLGQEVLWHAGNKKHNLASVGVEVLNPYHPELLKPGLPWTKTIEAAWVEKHPNANAQKPLYVVPTLAQAETLARLVAWITSPAAKGLAIPRKWVGVANGRMAMGRIPGGDQPAPGIHAHTYFRHFDGAWLVLYAWLRLEAGRAPGEAYDEAVRLATIKGTPSTKPATDPKDTIWVNLPAPRSSVGREVFESASYEFPWIG